MDNLRDGVTPPSEIEALRRELAEARRQQAAAADVLRIVSQSSSDAAPVFDAILAACLRLFSPYGAAIYLVDGDSVKGAARRGFADGDWGTDTTPLAGSSTGRAIAERRPVHIVDLAEVAGLPEDKRAAVSAYGGLTTLYAPMISGDRGVGSLVVARRPKRAFTPAEIASLSAFADQAVIAIETARLLRETREALAQQTATADVLKAINRSAFDPQSVLETLIDSAVSLTGSTNGMIWRYEDGLMHARAFAQGERRDAFIDHMRARPQAPGRGATVARIALTGEIQNIADVHADPDFPEELRRMVQTRATLGVPMKRGDDLIGAIVMSKPDPGAYPERVVELVKTFADQAVIAIENARLFEEVQGRTREVEEALAQQTATSEVLKVISRSPSDLKPVLDAIAETAARLCGSDMTMFFRFDGEAFRILASWNFPSDVQAMLEARPPAPGHPSALGRAGASLKPVYIPDVTADPSYGLRTEQSRARYRATLAVPMLREGQLVGALSLNRAEPGSFTPQHITLVSTFADQAAIAFENVRLFEEVQARTHDMEEALAQQTATADVLKTISRSVFDLDAVLQTLIDTAVRLARGSRGTIFIRDGEVLRARAFHSQAPPSLKEYLLANPIPLSDGEPIAVAVREGRLIHVPDMSIYDTQRVRETQSRAGFGAALWVPLMRGGEAIGLFGVPREEAIAFNAREIELVRTFADQAVIAIENARLFGEVQARTRDLSESLEYQTAISNVLGVISGSPNEVQPVLDTIVATARILCLAERAVVWNIEGDQFRPVAFSGMDSSSIEKIADHRLPTGGGSVAGQAAEQGHAIQLLDASVDPSVGRQQHELARAGNIHTILAAPLMSEGVATGCLTLSRTIAQRFDDRQVGLLQTFAEQAVIAIKNVRLFEEVQARTREAEQSLADLRKTQDRLVQSEKLASLGQLTAGIAHEIKNPLNFVNNFAALSRELLEELREPLQRLPIDARADADDLMGMIDSNLEKVVSHGKRADSIVKNMLLHSREGSGERALVNVNAMVEEALNLGYHGARAENPGFHVNIEKALDPDCGEANLYLQEITRVLLNLISNGFYATAKRREVEGPDYQPTLRASTRSLGDRIEIRIHDNGAGVPDEVRAKMFNPFFTTKPAGEGTGLGLSLTHDIVVKQHGGTIEVETAPGAFAEFIVTLPKGGAGA